MAEASALRDDLGAFSRAVHRPLTEWQTDALTLEAPITACVAPRQAGKSRSLAVLALHRAFRRRGQHVLIVSSSEDTARRLLRDIRDIAAGSELLAGSLVVEQAGLLTLTNGSQIRSVPASEKQIRGWTVDLLLVDEAALVADDLILGAAFPTTAARPEARIVLASSATVASGAFYDHVKLGESGIPHVRTVRWALKDATWISPTAVAVMRASMSETRFRAEMEGVFASGADSLFTRAILDAATADYPVTALADLHGPARVLGGIDWGATTDRSASVAIGRLPVEGDRQVFGVVMAQRWAAGYPLTDVIAELAACPAHWRVLTMERNGLGEPCCQHLTKRLRERPATEGGAPARAYTLVDDSPWGSAPAAPSVWDKPKQGFRAKLNPLHVSAEMKAATYSSLRLLIDGGQLVLPASATELLRELQLLRVDLSPSGTEKIEASSGHDDMADALALAMAPYRDASRRWRTVLADLADPRRKLPASDPFDVELPTVPTGSGLQVLAVPAFQSVAGPELTIPSRLHRRAEPINPYAARAHAERLSKERAHVSVT